MTGNRSSSRVRRCHRIALRVSTALGGMVLALVPAEQAWAADECGTPQDGKVVCTATGNPYPNGISYQETGDFSLTTTSDAVVKGPIDLTSTGMLTVNQGGSVTGYTGIWADGATGANVVSSGNVSATGFAGIVARGGSGSTTIHSASLTMANMFNEQAFGILGTSDQGDVSIRSDDMAVAGYGDTGISASVSSGHTITIDSGMIRTSGGASGISLNDYARNVDVKISSESIHMSGRFGSAIEVFLYGGSATIDSGSVTSSASEFQNGIEVVGDGAASIKSGNVQASGPGIYASLSGSISIDSGNVTANAASAIQADAGESLTITSKTISAVDGPGISASAYHGDLSITSGTVTIASGDAAFQPDLTAISAISGTGAIRIDSGTVVARGLYATGIAALSGGGNIEVDSGSLNIAGYGGRGITIDSRLGGDVSVINHQMTIADEASGIDVIAAAGSTSIESSSIVSSSDYSSAISASSTTGALTIKSGTIEASGHSVGISVFGGSGEDGLARVTSQSIQMSGGGSTGISVEVDKDATVASDRIAMTGDYSSAIGLGTFYGSLRLTSGSILMSGIDAQGITARSYDGDIAITSGLIAASGGTDGTLSLAISAISRAGSIAIDSDTISTTGTLGGAISANAGGLVTIRSNIVSTSGDNAEGIFAYGNQGVSVIANTITTGGANAHGVNAFSYGGATTIVANTVEVGGIGALAILAGAQNDVAVTLGAGAAADMPVVLATSTAGAADVFLTGTARTGVGPALVIAGATTARFSLGANGSLISANGGVQLSSGIGATVDNAGSIAGDASGPIITATGGALSFRNGGRFTGLVGFTDGDDTVINQGTYTAQFDQNFGGGSDQFVNAGSLLVRRKSAAPGAIAFTGLESFDNTGLIDLRDGRAGDQLTLSGRYAGAGSATLAVDLDESGATAISDRLVAAGAITGATRLLVAGSGISEGLNAGTVFAQGGEGSSANAFTLGDENLDRGFTRLSIAFDPATRDYSLLALPGDAVYRTLKISEGASQLWYKSADAWSAHLSAVRDGGAAPAGGEGRLWGQMFGEANTRKTNEVESALGQARAADLSYRQDVFGGQIGVDLAHGKGGAAVFGITGGYISSTLAFRASADHVAYDAANIGGYASVTRGRLFANLLAKYDRLWVRAADRTAGYADRFHGQAYGAQSELGYRLGGSSFYAEPLVSIAYARTDLGDLSALGARIDFDRLDGLRGKAGVRLAGTLDLGGGTTLVTYAQGNFVHEFEARDGIHFLDGGYDLPFRNRPIDDYGEGRLGLTIATPNGISGFLEGMGDVGSNYWGGGGRVGLRMRL